MMLYLRSFEFCFLILKFESKGEWDHAFVLVVSIHGPVT